MGTKIDNFKNSINYSKLHIAHLTEYLKAKEKEFC